MHFRKAKQYGFCRPLFSEGVYNVKPEGRDTIGAILSTRLFIVKKGWTKKEILTPVCN